MSDTQLFPPTPEERLAEVRTHLCDELEKREKAVESAVLKRDEAGRLLDTFDAALGAGEAVTAAVADMRRHAEDAGIGVSIKLNDDEPVVIAEAPAPDLTALADAELITSYRRLLDLITKPETCDRESGRAFDAHCEEMKDRGMSLEPAALTKRLREAEASGPDAPSVIALYPGADEPHVTTIGDRTTYLELIADYLTQDGSEGEPGDFRVIGEDDGEVRESKARIAAVDYGRRLLVVAR